jgi:hypothetical protein
LRFVPPGRLRPFVQLWSTRHHGETDADVIDRRLHAERLQTHPGAWRLPYVRRPSSVTFWS